jgi:hypothetical protein
MQQTVALLLASILSDGATTAPVPAKRPLLQTIRAARKECAKPGPKLEALVERDFDPVSFGRQVIPGWNELSNQQRTDFAELADAVVGAELRRSDVAWLCQSAKRITWVGRLQTGKGAPAITRVKTEFVLGGSPEYAEHWFRDDGDRWTYIGSWCCGVSAFDIRWRDTLEGGYDAAMAALRTRAK